MAVRKTRNDTKFWYCLYINDRIPGDVSVAGIGITGGSVVGDTTENLAYVIDEYGNETGELVPHYAEAVEMYANISPASGQAQVEQFGNLDNYDKVIVTHDMSCPIDEHTVLFIDKAPEYTEIITDYTVESSALLADDQEARVKYKLPKNDYIVKRVARSLNNIAIAVRKVDVG